MPPSFNFALEAQAYYVWCGAKQGREFARCDDPFSWNFAIRRMELLAKFTNPKFPSVNRIAGDAARDINRMLGDQMKVVGI
jgi:hypothetical protein